jgi:hypothetical protein
VTADESAGRCFFPDDVQVVRGSKQRAERFDAGGDKTMAIPGSRPLSLAFSVLH